MLDVHHRGRAVVSSGHARADGTRRQHAARLRAVGHVATGLVKVLAAAGSRPAAALEPARRPFLRALFDELADAIESDALAADDPVRQRLFPAGYPDDAEADAEYRSLTESGLRTDAPSARGPAPTELARGQIDLVARRGRRRPLDQGAQRRAACAGHPARHHRGRARTPTPDDPDFQEALGLLLADRAAGLAGPGADGLSRSLSLVSVLTIDRATRDAIVEHARRDHPDEACGVVAGAGGQRPSDPVRPDGQRGALADLLRVRLGRSAPALQGDGGQRRGAGGHLPLAHRDRGLPVAHRHLLCLRAERPLRAGLHPRRRGRPNSGRSRSSTALSPRSRSRWSTSYA